jgi:hypothetical protein
MKHKIITLIILLSVCLSCKEKEHLNLSFKNEILKFQEAYPLPEKTDSIFPFYIVNFHKIKNDTLCRISRVYTFSKKNYDHYEIFEDEKLKPTVIIDFNNLAKNIIKDYPKRKGQKLLKSPNLKTTNPYYVYKLKGKKISLLKKENY